MEEREYEVKNVCKTNRSGRGGGGGGLHKPVSVREIYVEVCYSSVQ